MAVYIGNSRGSLTTALAYPVKRLGIDITQFVGYTDENGVLQAPFTSSETLTAVRFDDDIVDLAPNALRELFKAKTMNMSIDFNNVEKLSGSYSMYYFAYQNKNLHRLYALNKIKEIGEYALSYAFYQSTKAKENGIVGELNFANLEKIEANGLSYAFYANYAVDKILFPKLKSIKANSLADTFYNCDIEYPVDFPALEEIVDSTPKSNDCQKAFYYTFYNNTKLPSVTFSKLKRICTYPSYSSTIPSYSTGLFYYTFYSCSNCTVHFPELEEICGVWTFRDAFNNLQNIKFPKLEKICGNGIFDRYWYSKTLPNGFKSFPALIAVRACNPTGGNDGASATGRMCQSTTVNGGIYFESIGQSGNVANQNALGFAVNAGESGLSFATAKNVTAFHFPATIRDIITQAFFTSHDIRFGVDSTSYNPSESVIKTPIYGDIVESIVVNGKRYYRYERESVYDNNYNKQYVCWVRRTATIAGNEYIYWPRGLYTKSFSSGGPEESYKSYFAWKTDNGYQFENAEITYSCPYYTDSREPHEGDRTYNSSYQVTSDVISNIQTEYVYTAFNSSTYKEPECPMYAWVGSNSKTYYSPFSTAAEFPSSNNYDAKRGTIQLKNDTGYYYFYIPAGTKKHSSMYAYSSDGETVTGYDYGSITLTRDSTKDSNTATTVYSDLGETVIGTIEKMNR